MQHVSIRTFDNWRAISYYFICPSRRASRRKLEIGVGEERKKSVQRFYYAMIITMIIIIIISLNFFEILSNLPPFLPTLIANVSNGDHLFALFVYIYTFVSISRNMK